MIVKFFNSGQGRGEEATEYLLNISYHNRQDNAPTLLRGDPQLTTDLINSLDFSWKYSSGVLSWHHDDKVTPENEQEIMNDFERIAFAGMEADQYNILWVRHSHANHHELHFVIPRVELSTGKSFNPCPPNSHKTYNPLRDYYNLKEGWARPDDIERARLCTPAHADIHFNRLKRLGKDVTKDEKHLIHEELVNFAIAKVESGMATCRDDLINAYKELGLTISRQGKDYITIHETEKSIKIRLKGVIFSESWRITTESKSTDREGQNSTRANNEPTLEGLRNEIERVYTSRCEYHRKRYANNKQTHKSIHKGKPQDISLQLDKLILSDNRDSYNKFDSFKFSGQADIEENRRGFNLEPYNKGKIKQTHTIREKHLSTRISSQNNSNSWNGNHSRKETEWNYGERDNSSSWNESGNRLATSRQGSHQIDKGINYERNRELSYSNIRRNTDRTKRNSFEGNSAFRRFQDPNKYASRRKFSRSNEFVRAIRRIAHGNYNVGTVIKELSRIIQGISNTIVRASYNAQTNQLSKSSSIYRGR